MATKKIKDLLEECGISKKGISAIKKGYEGMFWNKSIEDFKADFYGFDILIKTKMVLEGDYDSWAKNMEVIEVKQIKEVMKKFKKV